MRLTSQFYGESLGCCGIFQCEDCTDTPRNPWTTVLCRFTETIVGLIEVYVVDRTLHEYISLPVFLSEIVLTIIFSLPLSFQYGHEAARSDV